MNYEQTKPCPECPFLKENAKSYGKKRLEMYAQGEFPCHKTAKAVEQEDGPDEFIPTAESQHCAGALIYLEKRNRPHQMMRICERLGMYDHTKLCMEAKVV